MRRLTAEDYAVDAVTAAKALIGAWLCRRLDDGAVILRISNSFRNWMIVWGMLIVGHVAGLLLYCGLPTACESVWLMVMLPISAIAFAAIGPLSIVLFFLTLFRVQGGTTTAIFSLVCGVPLLCWVLFVLVRKMMKAKHRLSQWLLRVALACYSALSTFALLYGCSSI